MKKLTSKIETESQIRKQVDNSVRGWCWGGDRGTEQKKKVLMDMVNSVVIMSREQLEVGEVIREINGHGKNKINRPLKCYADDTAKSVIGQS